MSVKEAYLEKVRSQLAQWAAWIDQYRESAVDQRALQVLQRLEEAHDFACCQVESLQTARANAWESAKVAVEDALVSFKQVLDESGAGRAGHNLSIHSSRPHIVLLPPPRK